MHFARLLETTAGENFESLAKAEATISKLETENATLLDRVDRLENHKEPTYTW